MTEDHCEIHFEADGTELFAVQRGRGRPVVVLHGGLADHRASLHTFAGMSPGYRLIAPDLRAAGRSVCAELRGWDQLSDDLLALLDHLSLERAVVVGMSVGSAVALRFATKHPDRVEALVVASPVYSDEGLTEAQRTAFARMDACARASKTDGIEAIFELYAGLPNPLRDAALAMARDFDPGSVAATTGLLVSGVAPFERVDRCGVAAPTLVIPGDDPVHPQEVADAYAQGFPLATVVEPTSDVATAVETWLETNPPLGVLRLLVGPVGAGKSTFARSQVSKEGGVLLDLDLWMVRLFGDDVRPKTDVVGWYLDRRERCRALIWALARDLVRDGVDAYVELGLVTQAERALYVERARAEGMPLVMHVADAPRELRRERVRLRNESGAPFTQVVPPAFFEHASDAWEPMTDSETRGVAVQMIPDGRV
ncbi:MAG: alpha/beta fold hydrolase [Nannocystales bacterium]